MAAYCASKAGVEQFGNAMRLELRPPRRGGRHRAPSWVDTDLVRDAQRRPARVPRGARRLPLAARPASRAVQRCAAAFVDGIDRRRRRVYVPPTMAVVQALRTVVNGPLADLVVGRCARVSVPAMEDQVRSLGRGFGRSTAR